MLCKNQMKTNWRMSLPVMLASMIASRGRLMPHLKRTRTFRWTSIRSITHSPSNHNKDGYKEWEIKRRENETAEKKEDKTDGAADKTNEKKRGERTRKNHSLQVKKHCLLIKLLLKLIFWCYIFCRMSLKTCPANLSIFSIGKENKFGNI